MHDRPSAEATDSAPAFPTRSVTDPLDLLRSPPIRALVLWRGIPFAFQLALLVVFVGLTVVAWGVFTPAGVGAKLFAKANVVTLLIWGLWWPAMVWTAVIFGRLWCAVCPLELLSDVSEQAGGRFGVRQQPLPRWIARGSAIVALYALLQLLVAGLQIHRVPAYTSWFLIALMLLTMVSAIVFRHRAFCRGFCPVGLLLGTYGRGGMIAVRPNYLARGAPARPDARNCPSLLNPSRLDTNKDCLVCVQCIKAAPDRMRLELRRPYDDLDAREPVATWPVTLFVMLVSGFVIGELFTEWPAGQQVFLAAPRWLTRIVDAPAAAGWFEGVWALGLVPLVLWTGLAVILRLFRQKERVTGLWRRMAVPMVVIVAAAHMSKGLAKFVSWAPFLPSALRDPEGAATAVAITQKTIPAPASLIPLGVVSGIGLVLVITASFYAVREHLLSRQDDTRRFAAILPYGIVAALYVAIIANWGH